MSCPYGGKANGRREGGRDGKRGKGREEEEGEKVCSNFTPLWKLRVCLQLHHGGKADCQTILVYKEQTELGEGCPRSLHSA